MKNKVIHRAETRGHVNHGWLNTWHTFSFASYHDPQRVHFGALRVLNDDIVAGGTGFGMHPHDNMEIITIPIYGSLEHRDSMGNGTVIRKNEVQIMSAGTGIRHSEHNHSKNEDINLLQIWVFPKQKNITPNYDQKVFNPAERINKFQTVVEPSGINGVKIHQDAWFSLANLESDKSLTYRLNLETNGIYLFVIEGAVQVSNEQLNRRDGIGLWGGTEITIKATDLSEILVMEIPMQP